MILREYHRGADGPTAGRALAGTMTLLAVAVAVLGVAIGAVLGAAGRVDLREWILVVVASAALTTVVAGQSLSRARLRPFEFLALAVAATGRRPSGRGLLAARGDRAGLTYLTAYTAALVVAAVAAIAIGRPLLPTAARERTRAGVRLAAPLLPQALAMLGLLMGDVLLVNVLLGVGRRRRLPGRAPAGQHALRPRGRALQRLGPLVLSHPVEDRWRWTARTATSLVVVVGVGAAGVALLGPRLVRVMAPDFPQRSMSVSLGLITVVSVAYMVYQAHRSPSSTTSAPGAWPSPPRSRSSSSLSVPPGSTVRPGSPASRQPRQRPTSCSWRSRSMPHGP